MALLQVKYGPSTKLDVLTVTNGAMNVVTTTTSRTVGTGTIYDAALYFDLDNKRYQIQAAVASSLVNKVKLTLNGTNLLPNDGGYDGSSAITWNIPLAADIAAGLISNVAQSIYGAKTFKTNMTVEGSITSTGLMPSADNQKNIGSSTKKWANVYATTFTGNLVGNASTASEANHTVGILTIEKNANTNKTFNGSANVTLTLGDLIDGTIPLSYIPAAAQERIVAYGTYELAETALTNGDIQPGDLVQLADGVMYYVKDATTAGGNPTLASFTAGVANTANHVSNLLTLQLGGKSNQVTYNGSNPVTFTVPFADDSTAGLVTTSTQTFTGAKTFSGAVILNSGFTTTANSSITGTLTSASIIPSANDVSTLGSTNKQYSAVYATNFYGSLQGEATSADHVKTKLTFDGTGTNKGLGGNNGSAEYNGSQAVTIGVFVGAQNSAAGYAGLVPAPASGATNKFLKSTGQWADLPASTVVAKGTGINVSQSGATYTVSHASVPIGTTSTVGQGSDVILGRANDNTVSFNIPYLTVDSLGHISSKTTHTVTLGSITSEYSAADGGTLIGNVLGTDIYGGIAWDTF